MEGIIPLSVYLVSSICICPQVIQYKQYENKQDVNACIYFKWLELNQQNCMYNLHII